MRPIGQITRIHALALAGFAIAQPAFAAPAAPVQVAAAAPVAPAEPTLGPEAAALRGALGVATAGLEADEATDIMAFYAARDFRPFWGEPGMERGAALVAALETADAHGLPVRRYDPAALRTALAGNGTEPQEIAGAELRATRAYLLYARDLSSGLLTPSRVDEEITIRPARPERGALLARAASQPMAQALAGLEPASPEYRALMAEKARLENRTNLPDWGPEVSAGGTLRTGDSGPRVAELRARLAARGFVPPADAPAAIDPARFDIGLEAALRRFQATTGLDADGLAGARTVAAVNEAPEAALEQVVVNLERLRWMNRDLGPRYIVANIPDYSVRMVEDDVTVFTSRTVVGKAVETRTPEFSENMTYFVVNPTWHIPDSIAQRVYLPKLKANPNTLANSNMRIFTRAGTEINPGLVDFNQFASGNFPFRIKQNPSEANALGRVKFMFPNQFSIYLHDTPLRDLFAKSERAFSNGCVRVEQPLELAYLLLEGQVPDPAASFDAWLAAKSERTVQLERPIPVHLVYRTVFVDDAGALQRRFDVYGRDATVFEALQAEGVTLPAAQG